MRKMLSTLILIVVGILNISMLGISGEIVLNRVPRYGQLKMEFQDNIIIREIEGDPNYRFGMFIGDLAVDKEGNLFIIDIDRILKYDSSGKFKNKIGNIGEGPGEFQRPNKLFINERGDVYVRNRGKILDVFNNDGKFINQIIMSFMLSITTNSFIIDANDNIFAAAREMVASEPKNVMVKADLKGKILIKMEASKDRDTKVIRSPGGGGVMGGVSNEYSERFCFCLVKKSLFCYGTNSKYDFFVYDLDGNLKTEFSKEEDLVEISAEEKKRFGPDAVLPSHRPYFINILSDEEGRIYIIKTKSILDTNPNTDIDIFSSTGYFLYQTQVPFTPRVIMNGAFYSIEQDENHIRAIKKWVIKNYREMKTI